jgi:penicillin-binding protein 1A
MRVMKAKKTYFSRILNLFGWICWIIMLFLTLGLAFMVGFFSQVVQEMPLLDKLAVPEPVQASRIFTADDKLLGNVYAEEGNRIILTYDQIPEHLKKALIAVEDRDFYKHKGIDFRGITRALMANVEAGEIQQGGSTITQQLVRKLYLEKDNDTVRKFMRKIKEAIISIRLETKYSKDEILTFYLNEMFFGANSYGVEAAAHNYFGKSAKDLTLSESATIVGILQAPSVLNPYSTLDKFVSKSNELFKRLHESDILQADEYEKIINDSSRSARMVLLDTLLESGQISRDDYDQITKDPAIVRRNTVLKAMLSEGYINQAEYEKIREEKITLSGLRGNRGYKDLKHPYYATYVLEEAKKIVGQRKLYFGGLRIYTTLDTSIQETAEAKIREYIQSKEFQNKKISQGAFVLLENSTGAVKAMVGGVDFDQNEFNRAWQARRQPGSAFKPFVYLAALEKGYSPSSYVIDEPTTFHDKIGREYTPNNYDHKYYGIMTMKTAVEKSRNVVAVKTCDLVTPEEVIRWAKNMGIHDSKGLDPVLSIALGTGVVSVLEITSAYSTIANDGIYNKPFAIRMITDSNGEVIYENRQDPQRVAPENIARLMTYMLQGVVKQGTGSRARIKHDCAGKTGTTSDHKDAWFIGYTPEYTSSAWVGNDDESISMGSNVTGGLYPARIWHDIMEEACANLPPTEFKPPSRYPAATMSLERQYSQSVLQEKLAAENSEEEQGKKDLLELGGESEATDPGKKPDDDDEAGPGYNL